MFIKTNKREKGEGRRKGVRPHHRQAGPLPKWDEEEEMKMDEVHTTSHTHTVD